MKLKKNQIGDAKTKSSSKIKTFWCKIAHNSLPVAYNLKKRGIKTGDWCQVCGEEKETLNHMMFHCRVSKEIWSLDPTTFKVPNEDSAFLIQNLNSIIRCERKQGGDIELFYGFENLENEKEHCVIVNNEGRRSNLQIKILNRIGR